MKISTDRKSTRRGGGVKEISFNILRIKFTTSEKAAAPENYNQYLVTVTRMWEVICKKDDFI